MPIRRGKIYYAKVFRDGAENYERDGREWSFDFLVDKATLQEMEKEGVRAKPKNKGDDRGDYYQFRKPILKKDGSPAKPIEVVDKAGAPWDPDVAIGNESVVEIKYLLKEFEYKDKKGIKRNILAIRVVDHVPYEGGQREDFNYKDSDEWE